MGLSDSEAQKKAEKSLSNKTAQASILLAYKDIYPVNVSYLFHADFYYFAF